MLTVITSPIEQKVDPATEVTIRQLVTTCLYQVLFGDQRYDSTERIPDPLEITVNDWKSSPLTVMMYSDLQKSWVIPMLGSVECIVDFATGPEKIVAEFVYVDVTRETIEESTRTISRNVPRPSPLGILEPTILVSRSNPDKYLFVDTTVPQWVSSFIGPISDTRATEALFVKDAQGQYLNRSSGTSLFDHVSSSNRLYIAMDPTTLYSVTASYHEMPDGTAAYVEQSHRMVLSSPIVIGGYKHDRAWVDGSSFSICLGNGADPLIDARHSTMVHVRVDPSIQPNGIVAAVESVTTDSIKRTWTWSIDPRPDIGLNRRKVASISVTTYTDIEYFEVHVSEVLAEAVQSIYVTGRDGTLLGRYVFSVNEYHQENRFEFVMGPGPGLLTTDWIALHAGSSPTRVPLQVPLTLTNGAEYVFGDVYLHWSSDVLQPLCITIGSSVTSDVAVPKILLPALAASSAWIAQPTTDSVTRVRVEGYAPGGTVDWVLPVSYEIHILPTYIRICNNADGRLAWNPFTSGYQLPSDALSSIGGASSITFRSSVVDLAGQTPISFAFGSPGDAYLVYKLPSETAFRVESGVKIYEIHLDDTITLAYGNTSSESYSMEYGSNVYTIPNAPGLAHALRTSTPNALPIVTATNGPAYDQFAKFLALSAYTTAKRFHSFPRGYELVGAEMTRCVCRTPAIRISAVGTISSVSYTVDLVLRFYKDATLLTDTITVSFDLPPPLVNATFSNRNPSKAKPAWFGSQLAGLTLPVSLDIAKSIEAFVRSAAFV